MKMRAINLVSSLTRTVNTFLPTLWPDCQSDIRGIPEALPGTLRVGSFCPHSVQQNRANWPGGTEGGIKNYIGQFLIVWGYAFVELYLCFRIEFMTYLRCIGWGILVKSFDLTDLLS